MSERRIRFKEKGLAECGKYLLDTRGMWEISGRIAVETSVRDLEIRVRLAFVLEEDASRGLGFPRLAKSARRGASHAGELEVLTALHESPRAPNYCIYYVGCRKVLRTAVAVLRMTSGQG